MPRVARNVFKGEKLFHVMVQGINKEKIFIEEREKFEYIKLLNKYQGEYQIKVISYCIMDNHVHMLINVEDIENLTKYMHKLDTSYAIYYNKSNQRVGYVYRGRFKSEIIKDERHLYNCILYIHNNPVKARLCTDASQYKYSSYKRFFKDENREILEKLYINKEEYIKAHSKKTNLDRMFLEDEEGRNLDIKDEIEKYLYAKKINGLELRINNELLTPIVLRLKKIYELSNREIENYLNVSREKIRKIINENQ